MILKLLCIFVISIISINAQVDYCDKKLCKGAKHVACKHKGTFASKCPSGIQLIPMTSELKTIFLDGHNQIRNLLASGNHPKKFKSAARMCTVVWDSTLENLASLNVMDCTFEHDDCVAHLDYASIGQNLYKGYSTTVVSDIEVAYKALEKWMKEADDASQANLDKLGGKRGIGHFVQMINDRACKIGCGMGRWKCPKGTNHFYVMCNYSISNVSGLPAYNTTGTTCQTGYNPNYSSLCSIKEADIVQNENRMKIK